jgi:squalene synthase HpnC
MPFSSDTLPSVVGSLPDAYAACQRLTRGHYENFPVASLWLPRSLRPSVSAVYAFARCADDFADELGMDDSTRLARLSDWRRRLHSGVAHEGHPVFWALSDVFDRHSLPKDPFDKLLTAFEMDVQKNRHRTFSDLLYYCGHSANPVGEIVLRLFDGWTEPRQRWSNALCTALQLANFWQDVTVDALKNRMYVPSEDLSRFGVTEESVFRGPSSEALRKLIAHQVERTWTLFNEGKPLLSDSPKSLRKELGLVWLGGTEILRKIEAQRYDVWSRRPHVSRWDWLRLFGKLMVGV